jgi:4-carboxymuconolactone decarboxylase
MGAMARLGGLSEDELTDEQRAVYDAIKAGPRGRVSPPFLAWLRSPKFADRAQSLGAFLRFGTSLPRRVSELAILVTARHWDCAYEWVAHTRDALNAGLAQHVIDSLARDQVPAFTAEDEKAA